MNVPIYISRYFTTVTTIRDIKKCIESTVCTKSIEYVLF